MSVRQLVQIIGAVFLIVGTTIAGGMLALPISNAGLGFGLSTLYLFLCWLLMTGCAYLVLEVNLCLPPGANIISMAGATLGRAGEMLAWVTYLLLLYTLLSAYISGGAELVDSLVQYAHLHLPYFLSVLIFVSVLGTVVALGVQSIEMVNTLLMIIKLSLYLGLVALVSPYISFDSLVQMQPTWTLMPLMLMITSFGFSILVPSLRTVFQDDIPLLRRAMLIGSLIPLICYVVWDAVIMGVIPQSTLTALALHGEGTTSLTELLKTTLQHEGITALSRGFVSITLLTAFLGVSLSLSDFLADGCRLKKQGLSAVFIYLLTFIPPVVLILAFPHIFVPALQYAGLLCVILLILLPIMMSYAARYRHQLVMPYQFPCGKVGLMFGFIMALLLLAVGCQEQLGRFF